MMTQSVIPKAIKSEGQVMTLQLTAYIEQSPITFDAIGQLYFIANG